MSIAVADDRRSFLNMTGFILEIALVLFTGLFYIQYAGLRQLPLPDMVVFRNATAVSRAQAENMITHGRIRFYTLLNHKLVLISNEADEFYLDYRVNQDLLLQLGKSSTWINERSVGTHLDRLRQEKNRNDR